ncbi:unnamed protein product [Mycena citricolor]|uniref:Uncharacterized protein n=1 Tax=Mycena citricolor TaxID=2018698 RepID=A0AAD2HH72_9AGAR|nr:unnamed protein product [Mycena citricolor]
MSAADTQEQLCAPYLSPSAPSEPDPSVCAQKLELLQQPRVVHAPVLRLRPHARMGGRAVLGAAVHGPQRPLLPEPVRDVVRDGPGGDAELLGRGELAAEIRVDVSQHPCVICICIGCWNEPWSVDATCWKCTTASSRWSSRSSSGVCPVSPPAARPTELLTASPVMLILRTYALYERSRRVLGFVVGVAALVIAVAVWAVVAGPTTAADVKMPPLDLDRGCAAGVTRSQAAGLAIAWSSMMLFDCVIFVLTLYRALSRRRALGFQLLTVLLRDGAIYFGVMVLINVANILTFFMGKVDIMFTSDFLVACSSCNQQPYTKGVLATFTSTISSVMISRLMLNLRDPGLQKMPASHGTGTTSMSLGSGTDAPAHGVFSTYVSQAETANTAGTGYYSDHMELEQRLGGR